MEKKKVSIYVILLIIAVILLSSYIIYDKFFITEDEVVLEDVNSSSDSKDDEVNENLLKIFEKNDVISVSVGDNISQDVIVISDNGNYLTVITADVLFDARFHDYDGSDCIPPQADGSEDYSGCIYDYDDSSLKNEIELYTKNWSNIDSIRLLTIDEVEENVHNVGDRWSEHHFYTYEYEDFLTVENTSEISYWTSSEVDDYGTGTGGGIYLINIVNATLNPDYVASELNDYSLRSGTGFVTDTGGVRPVITISKEFIN